FDTINYADTVDTPLYPFGYGKSYTTFEYSDLTIDKNEIELKKLEKDGKFKVKVTVKNTGKYDGYEIVQLYVNDLVSTMTRPIKELKAFEKVFIKKGKSKTVTFTLDKSAFNYFNGKAQLVIEPGEFEIQVGTNCVDIFDKVVVEVK
ncbi:MAG: fibronectin type III-like domain-contianing protein, partial [Clostridia bacterium]|nr:fibronectin type III-like domain-contianing protein [Clostridia bacterium]